MAKPTTNAPPPAADKKSPEAAPAAGAPATPEPAAAASAAPPPPPYDPAALGDVIAKSVAAAMQPIVSQLAAMRPAPSAPVPEPIDDITDDVLNESVNAGNSAAAINRRASAIAKRAVREAVAEFAPRLEQMETVGLGNMSKIASRVALANLPYYGDYKAEIDAAVEASPAAFRANPDNLIYCYEVIIGHHAKEIADKAAEEAVRKLREDPTSGAALAGQGGRATETKDVEIDVVEVFGEQAARALEVNGLTLDGFAKKLGYESAKDYIEKTGIGGHA